MKITKYLNGEEVLDSKEIAEMGGILPTLADSRIFEVEVVNGEFRIWECCDGYYFVDLDRAAFLHLISSLWQLADKYRSETTLNDD